MYIISSGVIVPDQLAYLSSKSDSFLSSFLALKWPSYIPLEELSALSLGDDFLNLPTVAYMVRPIFASEIIPNVLIT